MNVRAHLERRRGGGFATVVMLALAVLMVLFVVSTQRTLYRVKQEVLRIEMRHAARQPEVVGTRTDAAVDTVEQRVPER